MGDTGFLPEEDDTDAPPDDDEGIDDFFGSQKVYLIELNDSGDTVVYTEHYWFQYAGTPALKIKEDMEVCAPRSICDVTPQFWGEVKWSPTGDTSLAHKTSVYYKGAFMALKEPEPVGVGVGAAPAEEPKKEEEPQGEPTGP